MGFLHKRAEKVRFRGKFLRSYVPDISRSESREQNVLPQTRDSREFWAGRVGVGRGYLRIHRDAERDERDQQVGSRAP